MPEEDRGECWWLVQRDGPPIAGDAGGAVAVLVEISLTRPLGRVLRALRAAPLLDAFDRLVARQRGRLGHLVREGPAPRRYP